MQLSQKISSFEKEDLLLFFNLILNTLEQLFQISLHGVFEFIAESDGEHKRMQSMHIFPSQMNLPDWLISYLKPTNQKRPLGFNQSVVNQGDNRQLKKWLLSGKVLAHMPLFTL